MIEGTKKKNYQQLACHWLRQRYKEVAALREHKSKNASDWRVIV